MDRLKIIKAFASPYMSGKRATTIGGIITSINKKTLSGIFVIQTPIKLKKELEKFNLEFNVFFLKNITGKHFIPQKGDYITCNYYIDKKKIIFINITSPLVRESNKTLSKIRTNPNKGKTKKSLNNIPKKIPRVFLIVGHGFDVEYVYKKPEELEIPKDWVRLETNQGRVYYSNNKTKITQWEHPSDNSRNILVLNKIKPRYEYLYAYYSGITEFKEVTKTPQYIVFSKLQLNYNTLKNGTGKAMCSKHNRIALIFCSTCFDENDGGFLCSECYQDDADKHTNTTYSKLIYENRFDDIELVKDYPRIDLKNDFRDITNNKITYLNGQTVGRQGITYTSYEIMDLMQRSQEFRELIYNATNMSDMKKIDTVLNRINKQYFLHENRTDTSFSIYPRKNLYKYISGPRDSSVQFDAHPHPESAGRNEYLNGRSWPLGIFELPLFDKSNPASLGKVRTLFKNNLMDLGKSSTLDSFIYEWKFFSIIKETDPLTVLERTLLCSLPNNNSVEGKKLKSWEDEITIITKYNRLILSKITDDGLFNPGRHFQISDIIRDTISISNIKRGEDIIFISNICRGIKYPNYADDYQWNQLANMGNLDEYGHVPDQIKKIIIDRRRNSIIN